MVNWMEGKLAKFTSATMIPAENVQKNTNKKKGDGTMGKRVAASNKALQKWLLELGNDMIIKLKFHIRLG